MSGLAGRVAVVTGASRGVGRRVAVRLARDGATVALVARGAAGLNETAAEIAQHGGRSAVFTTDLSYSSPVAIATLRGSIERELGAPSILVNGAGVFGPISLIKDVDTAAWLETIAINALTPFLLCQAFVGGMIADVIAVIGSLDVVMGDVDR